MSVLVVGSMAVDTVEFAGTGEKHELVGGSATFAALAASLLTEARLVGVIGSDFPTNMLDELRKRRVDLAGVQIEKGETFRWHGRYSADLSSRESLATHLNVFETFRPKIPIAIHARRAWFCSATFTRLCSRRYWTRSNACRTSSRPIR